MLNLLLEGHLVEDVVYLLGLDYGTLGEDLHSVELGLSVLEELARIERELSQVHLGDCLARLHWTSLQRTIGCSG